MRRKYNVSQLSALLDNHHIRAVETINFLGLVVDYRLSFSDHVCTRISTRIFVLSQSLHYVGRDVLITAYNGVVYLFLACTLVI